MPSLPINVRLDGRLVSIAGGGNAALRKASALIAAGARLRIVGPHIDGRFDELSAHCELIRREFADKDLDGAVLVIAATGDAHLDARVCAAARARNILAHDSSEPGGGDFTIPALLHDDAATITRAAATLHAMHEYVLGVVPPDRRAGIMRDAQMLDPEKLAAMNPADAQHEIDAIVERARGIEETAATNTVVSASRASKLALTQTRTIAAMLAKSGLATTILPISTLGDRVQDRSLAAIGAENLFVKELELALRDGRAHYAVHSCKDLPSELPADMTLAAISTREDPRDAFCSERFESFAALPAGARVGTSSLRRRAQLMMLRPDLEYLDIRGNVDTRLRKLREDGYDAIVLAMAGLRRLGTGARYTVPFDPAEIVPAVGQGALAIEMLATAGQERQTIRSAVNDAQTEIAVSAERAALAALRGGCQAPVGIHARTQGVALLLQGIVVSPDGAKAVRATLHEPATSVAAAVKLGERLAAQLIASGAEQILRQSLVAEPAPANPS